MEDKSSITALMSAFGRAFHAENEEYPVFRDDLAREWMTAEEDAALQSYVLCAELRFSKRKRIGISMRGGRFFGTL